MDLNQRNWPYLLIVIGLLLAVLTGVGSHDLATDSSTKKSEIPADAVTATGSAQGMEGPVVVEVIATQDRMYSVKVTEQGETEGIGTLAVEQLPPLIFQANSVNVDAVSGATVTSTAIKRAVLDALNNAGLDASKFGELEEEPVPETTAAAEIPETALKAEAAGPGLNGDVKVEVVADEDRIYAISVTEHNETEGIGTKAVDQIPAAIVNSQSTEVDAVAGATITSEAIRTAVKAALDEMGIDAAKFAVEPAVSTKEEEAVPETTAAAEIPDTALKAEAAGPGINGDVKVEVTADENGIYAVTVTEHSETEGIGTMAIDQLPAAIVNSQSTEVDAVAGATITSEAIRTAVKAALDEMGIDESKFAAGAASEAKDDGEVAGPEDETKDGSAMEAGTEDGSAMEAETEEESVITEDEDMTNAARYLNRYNSGTEKTADAAKESEAETEVETEAAYKTNASAYLNRYSGAA